METATFKTTAEAAAEDQATEFKMPDTEAVDNEVAQEPWDYALFTLVSANAEVKVRCSWMDDAEVTLGDAMLAYPRTMTAADEPFLISVVNEMLANRVIQTEDLGEEPGAEAEQEVVAPEKKQEPQENKAVPTKESGWRAEAKVLAVEIDSKTIKKQRQPQQITNAARQSGIPSARQENPHQPETTVQAATLEPVVDVRPRQISHSKPEVLEGEIVINRKKAAAEQQAETLGITEIESKTTSTHEERPVSVGTQVAADQRPEFPTQPLSVEAPTESEYITPVTLEVKSQVVLDEDTVAPTDEAVEVIEGRPPLMTADYQINTSGPGDSSSEDSSQEEVATDHLAIAPPETIDYNSSIEEVLTLQTDDTLKFSAETRAAELKQPAEVGVTTEQIESSLTWLVECIKDSDSQTTQMANERFDKIIEVAVRIEAPSGENTITEAEVGEELEELFTELFDLVSIPHTPELIEYLVRQTLTRHLVDEIKKLKNEEAIDEAPQDDGIHMMIKKLIAGLKTLKRSIAHYCTIGRVALVLCSFNAQFTPRPLN